MALNFEPIEGTPYQYDYLAIFREIAAGRLDGLKTYRGLCHDDLFFLLYFGLGRVDVNHPWIVARIREVEADHNGTLDLWAREHYKSTILTYAQPIQELIHDPEERIGIFSHTRPAAKSFLRQIKQTLEGNCLAKKWFPDVFFAQPKRQAPKWSEDDGLIVKRKSFAKEASIEAWGLVDGQPAGKHFTIRVYDDVVTRESVTTSEQLRKTVEAYEISQSLGTDQGQKRVTGTHYSFADLYAQLRKRDSYKVRIHPATHDGTSTGEPVFLSPERLAELKREQSSYVFACQQLLNPVADEERRFKEEWIKHYGEPPLGCNRYLICDPANAKKKDSDFTVMATIAIDHDGNRFLLDMLRDKLNLTERWKALRDMYQKWRPLRIGYEQYGMQSDVQHFEERMRLEKVYFSITPLGGQVSKEDRILRLVPSFEQGKFWLPEKLMYKGRDLIKEFIAEELLFFPFSSHDDMLDCLARIEDKDMDARPPSRPALHPRLREYKPLEYVHRREARA
jgi:phage terminase large subunit-like protein